jgi:hypothetical protein
MKTAISFLKLIAFLLLLQWLCSCNRQDRLIMQLEYLDSIGIATNRINEIVSLRKYDSAAIRELDAIQLNCIRYNRIIDSLKQINNK